MPPYPQPRQRPPRNPPPQPPSPPVPRDETGTPFPLPDPPPRSRAQALLRRKQQRRSHLHLTAPVRRDLLLLRDTYLHHREVRATAREEGRFRDILRRQRRLGRRQRRQRERQQQGQQSGEGEEGEGEGEGEDGLPGWCSDTSPPSPPPPPCLRCALKGMHCSATMAGHEDEVRCQRCERNGEESCVRQSGGGGFLAAGGSNRVLDPAWLREVTRGLDPAMRDDPVAGSKAVEEIVRGEGRQGGLVDPFGVGKDGKEVWERECMVYCLDPVLQGDRDRLLDIAADLLHQDGAKFVHGTEVSVVHARNFALPMWHENDKPGNQRDPVYDMRVPAAYFRDVEARREDRRVEMEMWVSKKRAEEANKAEKERLEMEMRAGKKRIDEEREKVRKFYREQGSDKDKARRRAETRRVIGEQMALGMHPFRDIKPYMDGLTDKWIEEIKLGLRTDLPF